MREIKFRGWHEGTKEMFNIDVLALNECSWSCPDPGMRGVSLAYQPQIVVMQFTGLTDKNGKEIYEGDIVVRDDYPHFHEGKPNYRSTVEWVFSGFQTVLHCVNPKRGGISEGINEQIEDGEDLEVIGNIYETPELLNKGA